MPMPIERKQVPIHFPVGGLNELTSYIDQPEGTSPELMNVVAFEGTTGRGRGGSRGGTEKMCAVKVDAPATWMAGEYTAGIKVTNDGVVYVAIATTSTEPPGVGWSVSSGYAIQELSHVTSFVEAGIELREDGTRCLREALSGGGECDREPGSISNAGERLVTVIGVAAGFINVLTETTSTRANGQTGVGSLAMNSMVTVIVAEQFDFDLYLIDGINYRVYDASSNTVENWEDNVTTLGSGTIPRDTAGNGATIMCVWNGRIVLAGLKLTPTFFFMSAQGDSLNWNFVPATETVTQAVRSDLAECNSPADIITALIPCTDDTLILGCAHSIERLSGDPAPGNDGRRDLVTNVTGVAEGRAWCMTPEGVIYFFGSRGGVYRMLSNGSPPERLTAKSIDHRLARLHMQDNLFRLIWNDVDQSVLVFITPREGGPTTHYRYDVRKDAWFPLSFANDTANGVAVHLLDGYSDGTRAILLGALDGYCRKLNLDAVTDDGEPIESSVLCGPFKDMMVMELMATLGRFSGNVDWALIEAQSIEEALNAAPVAIGRFEAGRNRSQWPRRYLRGGFLRLSSTEPWQFEALTATLELSGSHRSRIFF
jgi:hypothetical protein